MRCICVAIWHEIFPPGVAEDIPVIKKRNVTPSGNNKVILKRIRWWFLDFFFRFNVGLYIFCSITSIIQNYQNAADSLVCLNVV